jgi:hypothetical protein
MRTLYSLLLVALLGLLGPATVAAQTLVASKTITITEPTIPTFVATQQVDVFLTGTEFTYVYTIMNSASSGAALTSFVLDLSLTPASCSLSVGFDSTGTGIVPSNGGALVGTQAIWQFQSPSIAPGLDSVGLLVTSDCGPMDGFPVSLSDEFAFDGQGESLGPMVEPMEPAGEPLPCTIGFWKNRSEGKRGLEQFFPDGDFAILVSDAVALSGGIFADEAALITALQSKGNRSQEERARQQLSAFLLNLAAGDDLPDNQKCKLFEGNLVTTNACGTDITVGDALSVIFDAFATGSFEAAKDCADDTNNGIGIDDTVGGM